VEPVMPLFAELYVKRFTENPNPGRQTTPRTIDMIRTSALLLFLVLSLAIPCQGQTAAEPPSQENFSKELVFEPVFRSRVFILEGGKNHDQSVVLIPGLGDLGSDTWKSLVPILAERYHVVAFDLPGFGRSEKKNALYSPARYGEFVHWLVDRYVDGPFHLIGHSLGGSVALQFAATRPDNLQKLILADVAGMLHRAVITNHFLRPGLKERVPLSPDQPLEMLDDLIGATILGLEDLPLDPDILLENEVLRATVLGGDPVKIAALALVESNFSSILPRIEVPTLILWGAEDRATPLRTGILLEGTLNNARLVNIPRAGHMPMFEQTDRFNQEVIDFLAAPAPRPPVPPSTGTRTETFRDQSGLTLEGSYRTIRLINCKNVRLTGVSAESIEIVGSTVSLQNCRIAGQETGMLVKDSTVTGTALTVEADLALEVSRSSLDLAGALLKGRKAAVRCGDESTILFSASRSVSPLSSYYLHGKMTVTSQNLL
jgi:pimeloyl-ACP methyl ester carboxylesterase